MSDFTHCQLLYSPLSSSAFLNMHALHFPTTFQIQMDVPCSRLHSLLPPLPSCLCSLHLCFICGWPNFQVWSILQCRGRLWSDRLTDRHKGASTSWHRCLRCAHYCAHLPFCKNEPITLRLPVPNPDPLLCLCGSRHTRYPSCSSTTPFTVWSDERIGGSSIVSLIRCNRVGRRASTTLHYFTSCALRNLRPGADLRNSSCQKSTGSSLEGYSGGRDGRTGLAAYPFVWVHHDSMTWSTSRKCIWKSEMIVQFCKIEYSNTSLVLQLPVSVCLAESKLLLLPLMMTYKCLT